MKWRESKGQEEEGNIKETEGTKRRSRKAGRREGKGDRTRGIQGENDGESEGLAQRL